ncbi:hypothetical protein RRG08_062319 [Elysia crispata]|uniref:Uncharacterized protein n=1 Tax=Elysia crispata TaxID=231223 RepID=A0AAE0YGH4_9GAST|nr:hypothetical protein RRG08_062319 [Elysia crispata]
MSPPADSEQVTRRHNVDLLKTTCGQCRRSLDHYRLQGSFRWLWINSMFVVDTQLSHPCELQAKDVVFPHKDLHRRPETEVFLQ